VSDKHVRRRFFEGTSAEDLKSYMAPFVERLGYKLNTDTDFVEVTLVAELQILEETGDVYCPCRIRTGDPKEDAKMVCPCIRFHVDEFAAMGKCWCGLFVHKDVTDPDSLRQIPLNELNI